MGKHLEKPYLSISNQAAAGVTLFRDDADYMRFLHILYICNSSTPATFDYSRGTDPFAEKRQRPLVDIVGYCLIPDTFRLILKDRSLRGKVDTFMHKVCTAYAMYYKSRYDHTGAVFKGSYSSVLVGDAEAASGRLSGLHTLPSILTPPIDPQRYPYSSCKDHMGIDRPATVILWKKFRESLGANLQ